MIMMNKEVKVLYDEVFCIGAVIHEIEKNEFPGLRPGLPCWTCEPHVNSTNYLYTFRVLSGTSPSRRYRPKTTAKPQEIYIRKESLYISPSTKATKKLVHDSYCMRALRR